MKLSQVWWLVKPQNKIKTIDTESVWVKHRGKTYHNLSIKRGNSYPAAHPPEGTYHFLYGSGRTDKGGTWGYETRIVMASKFIVDSSISMLEDPNMREKWEPATKNSYVFADIVVGPCGLSFQSQPIKMNFLQRMKFLRAFGSLQEYHHVKKFRDSVAAALESCCVKDDDKFRSGM